MSERKRVLIGYIKKPHGLHGELKFEPYLPDPSYFKRLESIFIETQSAVEKLYIEDVRDMVSCFILKLRSYNTIESVEGFKGAKITVDRNKISDPPEGEYFQFDIIGMHAITEDGGIPLGVVTSIIETGANDVFVLNEGDKEILVPATHEVVTDININKKKMTLRLLKGMIEDT